MSGQQRDRLRGALETAFSHREAEANVEDGVSHGNEAGKEKPAVSSAELGIPLESSDVDGGNDRSF